MPPYKPVTRQEANLLKVLSELKAGGRLVDEEFDYIGTAYPNGTTEVYTYKSGGSSGTIVASVTVTYTDSTKDNVSSVART